MAALTMGLRHTLTTKGAVTLLATLTPEHRVASARDLGELPTHTLYRARQAVFDVAKARPRVKAKAIRLIDEIIVRRARALSHPSYLPPLHG